MAKAVKKKTDKEASNLFHNIIGASVKGNPKPNIKPVEKSLKAIEHPYKKYEGSKKWRKIESALDKLEINGDVNITTAKEYVVGFLCKELDEKNTGV